MSAIWTHTAPPICASLIRNQRENERHGGGESELYDLIAAPLERTNLASDPAHAPVVADLAAQLAAWQQDLPPVPVIEGVAPQDPGEMPAPTERKQRKKAKASRE